MTADEAHQEAYQHVLPKLRRNIMSNYVRKIVDAATLHKDHVHKKIMSTKRKLQEDDDYGAQEVIKYAVKKYLSFKRPQVAWVMMNLRMKKKEVNKSSSVT